MWFFIPIIIQYAHILYYVLLAIRQYLICKTPVSVNFTLLTIHMQIHHSEYLLISIDVATDSSVLPSIQDTWQSNGDVGCCSRHVSISDFSVSCVTFLCDGFTWLKIDRQNKLSNKVHLIWHIIMYCSSRNSLPSYCRM